MFLRKWRNLIHFEKNGKILPYKITMFKANSKNVLMQWGSAPLHPIAPSLRFTRWSTHTQLISPPLRKALVAPLKLILNINWFSVNFHVFLLNNQFLFLSVYLLNNPVSCPCIYWITLYSFLYNYWITLYSCYVCIF